MFRPFPRASVCTLCPKSYYMLHITLLLSAHYTGVVRPLIYVYLLFRRLPEGEERGTRGEGNKKGEKKGELKKKGGSVKRGGKGSLKRKGRWRRGKGGETDGSLRGKGK